jgi:hypothetical protein
MEEPTLEQLQNLIKELAWNNNFDCYTRQGFEKIIWPRIKDKARWIIFFDVDDMHGLNNSLSYESVNAIIKKSLVVRESDFAAGQWFSGDEFIVCITDDDPKRDVSNPIEFAIRLSAAFRENGAPATFAITPVISDDLFASVAPAHKLVQQSKSHYQHGTISIVPGDPR